jgi:predicted ATPase
MAAQANPAPDGTVAFLFTDVDDWTVRYEAHPAEMEAALRQYDALLRKAVGERSGYVFKAVRDAHFVAFASVSDAILAARTLQRLVLDADAGAAGGLGVRAAIHVGAVESRDGDYFGRPLNRVARILGAAHANQILISSAAAELAGDALREGATLHDLGRHRLKDLETPEHLFQLAVPELPVEFPRLRSLQTTPNNLPVQPTRFLGREAELADLRARFKTTHVLTLLGFGGIGKTRLALQLAAESLDRFPDGVWFVDLSPIVDPEVVADEAARTIGATPARDQTGTEAAIGALRDQEALLVFDGCEHVLQSVAQLASAILRACPRVRAIATSRQALGIGGESVYKVDVFASPPPTVESAREAAAYPAVQLFVERCSAASASFAMSDANAAAVAEICRSLDGIALALELAAPKMAVLSPRQLADRLGERFRLLSAGRRAVLPRQQTLRALIDWSFDLLDEDERTVFRRLSAFAGSWTLEAAGVVCQDRSIDAWRVFDLASALVAKSLVAAEGEGEERRFHLLDSIREYGREKLHAANEADVVAANAARYYADFLAAQQPLVDAVDEEGWRAAVEPEIDNIRSSADWTLVRGKEPQLGRTLLARFEWPHAVTGAREAIRWYDLAAAYPEPFASPLDEVRFHRHYARLAWLVGRSIAWREDAARSALAVARTTFEPTEVALALKHLGDAYLDGGRHDEADAVFEEALGTSDLPVHVRRVILADRAINDLERGALEVARQRFADVARMEKPGSVGHGIALLNLAELEFATGNFEAARHSGRVAKEILERLRAAPLVLLACNRAAYEMAVDELEEARACLREALDHSRDSGQVWTITALEHHAVYCGLVGELERALLLLGHTDAHVRAGGATRKSTERHGHARLEELLTAAFGEAQFRRRLGTGAVLSLEQALHIASEIHTS